jgi:hypothetical protein
MTKSATETFLQKNLFRSHRSSEPRIGAKVSELRDNDSDRGRFVKVWLRFQVEQVLLNYELSL